MPDRSPPTLVCRPPGGPRALSCKPKPTRECGGRRAKPTWSGAMQEAHGRRTGGWREKCGVNCSSVSPWPRRTSSPSPTTPSRRTRAQPRWPLSVPRAGSQRLRPRAAASSKPVSTKSTITAAGNNRGREAGRSQGPGRCRCLNVSRRHPNPERSRPPGPSCYRAWPQMGLRRLHNLVVRPAVGREPGETRLEPK